jgi:hypothetical protein
MILSSNSIDISTVFPTRSQQMRVLLFEYLCVQTLCFHSLHLTFLMLLAHFSLLFEVRLVYCRHHRYCCITITLTNPVNFSDDSLQRYYNVWDNNPEKFNLTNTSRENLKTYVINMLLVVIFLPHTGREASDTLPPKYAHSSNNY